VIGAALILVGLIGAWELYVDVGSINALILPAPHAVAQSLWVDRGLLWSSLRVTAGEIVFGLACALLAGLILAVALHRFRVLRGSVYPLLVSSQTIPIPVIAPLLVFWWGFGMAPKVFIIALVCFFPIVVATLNALESIDVNQIKLMGTLGASSSQVFRWVEAPAALPGLFTGARLAVAIAAIAAVLAESSGSTSGLGQLIQQSTSQLDTARSYAALVLLSLISVSLFAVLGLVERRFVPWSRQARRA
jgi:ABC-type nitrate/sulfonate/bicarbonate transport system permease component